MDVKHTEQSVAPAGALRRSVSLSLGGKAVEICTLALLATVVPRVLGPSDYGRFSVPLTIVTLGSLAMTLGGPTLMARYVPAAAINERVALAKAIGARLARGRALQLAGIAGVAALAVAADAVTPLVTAIVVASLALNVVATLALQVALGLGRTGAWSFRYPIQNAVLIGAVLVLHSRSGSDGAILAVALAAIAGAGFAALVVVPIVRLPTRRVPVPDGAIRFGVHQATGAALTQFSQRGSVIAAALLTTSTASAAETGYVALATGIALGVTYAVLQTFTVSLTHLTDADEIAGAEQVLRRLAGGLLVVIAPAAVGGVLLLDRLVPVLFGADYAGAVDAFVPALALVVLAPLYSLGVQVAAVRMRPQAASASGIASALTFVVAALVAVPTWGAAGATAASLVGGVAGAVVSVRMLPGAFGARVVGITAAGIAAVVAASQRV